jgi:CheY-like chemotaxis protein
MSSSSSDALSDSTEADAPTVLVATDDRWMRQLLDAILSDAGYPTLQFGDSAGLLATLRGAGQPYIVLLSLCEPPMNNQNVLTEVAADPALATRHVYILLTAHWDMLPADFADLLSRLAVPVVPKPFALASLLDAVAHAVARAREIEGWGG